MSIPIREGRWGDRKVLMEIWFRAVRATHNFLNEKEIDYYYQFMRDQYLPTAKIWVALDGNYQVGFLGYTANKIDSLFIDSSHHGKGYGTALIKRAVENGCNIVDVNEPNHNARKFYRKHNFIEDGRFTQSAIIDEEEHIFPHVKMLLK